MDFGRKKKGIHDLLMLSKEGIPQDLELLMAFLYFWKGATNTFQFPCGMLTPTLFDVTAIIGLRPTREIFDPNECDEDAIGFNNSRASFKNFITDYHDTKTTLVSDKEHVAFLELWLSRYGFCCKSIKVEKKIHYASQQSTKGGTYVWANYCVLPYTNI